MKGATNYSLTTKSHGVLHIAYCISEVAVASLICNFHGLIIIVCLPSQEKKNIKNTYQLCVRFHLGRLSHPGEIANDSYAIFFRGKQGILWAM